MMFNPRSILPLFGLLCLWPLLPVFSDQSSKDAEEAQLMVAQLYAGMISQVKATSTKTDDVALAEQMLSQTQLIQDDPQLVLALYEQIIQLTRGYVQGQTVHDQAVAGRKQLLPKAPEKPLVDAVAEKRTEYIKARGRDQKIAIGHELVRLQLAYARELLNNSDSDKASLQIKSAVAVAKVTQSSALSEAEALQQKIAGSRLTLKQIEVLKRKLLANPQDQRTAGEIANLYFFELGMLTQAAEFYALAGQTDAAELLPLLEKPADQIDPRQLAAIAEWLIDQAANIKNGKGQSPILAKAEDLFIALAKRVFHLDSPIRLSAVVGLRRIHELRQTPPAIATATTKKWTQDAVTAYHFDKDSTVNERLLPSNATVLDLADMSRFRRDAGSHGVKFTRGVQGEALNFDGDHLGVFMPASDFSGDFSLNFSFKIASAENRGTLFYLSPKSYGEPYFSIYQSRDQLNIRSTKAPEHSTRIETDRGTLKPGFWHHLLLNVHADGKTQLYLDGKLIEGTLTPLPDVNRAFNYLGRAYHRTAFRFTGAIDDLVIWDRTLNALEIRQIISTRKTKSIAREVAKATDWSPRLKMDRQDVNWRDLMLTENEDTKRLYARRIAMNLHGKAIDKANTRHWQEALLIAQQASRLGKYAPSIVSKVGFLQRYLAPYAEKAQLTAAAPLAADSIDLYLNELDDVSGALALAQELGSDPATISMLSLSTRAKETLDTRSLEQLAEWYLARGAQAGDKGAFALVRARDYLEQLSLKFPRTSQKQTKINNELAKVESLIGLLPEDNQPGRNEPIEMIHTLEDFARAVRVKSQGKDQGFVHISLNNRQYASGSRTAGPEWTNKAGLNVIAFKDGNVIGREQFNTTDSAEANDKFANWYTKLPEDSFVVIAACSDVSMHLNSKGQDTLQRLGAKQSLLSRPTSPKANASYLLISQTGKPPRVVIEKINLAGQPILHNLKK